MTHPDRRHEGLGSLAVEQATRALTGYGIDFLLLFCEAATRPFYTRLGWSRFDGAVFARQWGRRTRFTVVGAMLRDDRCGVDPAREIDLRGLPW